MQRERIAESRKLAESQWRVIISRVRVGVRAPQ